jgi:hypothetical protein
MMTRTHTHVDLTVVINTSSALTDKIWRTKKDSLSGCSEDSASLYKIEIEGSQPKL